MLALLRQTPVFRHGHITNLLGQQLVPELSVISGRFADGRTAANRARITTLDYCILSISLHAAHIVGFKERGTNVIAADVIRNCQKEDNILRQIVFLTVIPLFVILLTHTSMAQPIHQEVGYVSVHAGAFASSLEGFHDIYGSVPALDFGVGFAIPLFNHIRFCGGASYVLKNGTYNWPLPDWPGPAEYRQWTLNGGVEYDLPLSTVYDLDLSAGVAFSTASEGYRTLRGTMRYGGLPGVVSGSDESIGYFAGFAFQRRLGLTPLALFIAGQYTSAPMTILRAEGNYGGVSMSAGLRYLFAL